MTELERTPRNISRLFRTVDLAPLPRNETVSHAYDIWRNQRGPRLAPGYEDLLKHWPGDVCARSFLARALPDECDYTLSAIGPRAAYLLKGQGKRLTQITERRVAVRLRHLFRMAIDRGEAISAQFVDDDRIYEALAAPVLDGGAPRIFCTLICDKI